MARIRDYKAEYRRRIERGLTRGLSRSQARGHPKVGEAFTSTGRVKPQADDKLLAALKLLHQGDSQRAAAKSAGITADRLRRFTATNRLAHWDGSKWVMTDDLPRRVKVLTKGTYKSVIVGGFDEASKAGAFENAAGQATETNDPELLLPFKGDGVTDVNGRFHPFETDLNELHRLRQMELPPFHEIYQIISPD